MNPSQPTPTPESADAADSRSPAGRPPATVTVTADEQDILWMIRIRAGDRQAFAELVECHQQRVVGTVARMLGGDAADAEDIGQQVFLRVWKSAPRYEPTAKFTTWLYTITRNLVFNELRRRKHRPVVSLDAQMPGETGAGEGSARIEDTQAAGPDATLLEAELQQAIAAAIEQLPEAQRLAIIMRRYEDLSYEEIASVLKLTVPAVKSLLFRARVILREKLARYLDA
jgi:RNA polymerase sigma-70 factor (ECF subfamily)